MLSELIKVILEMHVLNGSRSHFIFHCYFQIIHPVVLESRIRYPNALYPVEVRTPMKILAGSANFVEQGAPARGDSQPIVDKVC